MVRTVCNRFCASTPRTYVARILAFNVWRNNLATTIHPSNKPNNACRSMFVVSAQYSGMIFFPVFPE